MWWYFLIGAWLLYIPIVIVSAWREQSRFNKAWRRADRIVSGIDKLRESQTATITLSCNVDGWETVIVVDDWTGYAEQVFYSTTVEGAIDDALRSRGVDD